MFQAMTLSSLSYDTLTSDPIILLRDMDDSKSFLVKGCNLDVRYLVSEFSGTVSDAASAYVLVVQMVRSLGGQIVRLSIKADKEEQIGIITVSAGSNRIERPCRPIDVVLLAHRLSRVIYVDEDLLNQVETMNVLEGSKIEEKFNNLRFEKDGQEKPDPDVYLM